MKPRLLAVMMLQSAACWLVPVLLDAPLRAQVPIYRGDTLPVSSGMTAWFLDTINHLAWVDTDKYWKMVPSRYAVEEIVDCAGRLILKTERGYELWENLEKVDQVFAEVVCGESTYFSVSKIRDEIQLRDASNAVKYGLQGWPSWSGSVRPQIVAGKLVFCVPYIAPDSNFSCAQLKAWGMMSVTGDWVIPPRFDEMFRFKKGFAKVVYYGRRRKINERGTFIE